MHNICIVVEGDESLTTRIPAANFNVDGSTIVSRHKKLGKAWGLVKQITNKLSDNNKFERIRIFTDLLQRNEQSPSLKDLVTENESWLLFKNLKRKKVCVLLGVLPEGITAVRSQCGVVGGTGV
ncbi:hypothetical protein TNIN_343031 [Trichonephila inaurata madagascariensis]|uniref:Uncharacterized protein n=1 Tax=Trichonephila inaurata madagascariensis TaxID=2747483 RepID=A0A8X7BTL3_9ARAC|nr:hypothetical protein TNIN_343031 [Trichonephila inaurata madagascariensis]